MAQDYAEYLTINLFNEKQIVSYRLLSRALKVHVNLAKQILYDFHRKQNAKKPGSVHATYLVTGIRRIEAPKAATPPPAPPTPPTIQINGTDAQKNGDDVVMPSSPALPSSSMPQPEEEAGPPEPTYIRSITIVKEKDLEQAKETFDTISSIHIYSLGPSGQNDLQVLTECNRRIATEYASEDPLIAWKQYGTIQNPNVKRRKMGNPPPPPAPVAKDADVKTKALAPTSKADQKPRSKPSSAKATPEPEKKTSKPAATNRQSSGIFASFAKSKSKPRMESQSSAEATPAAEDTAMGGLSDDEEDNEDVGEVAAKPAQVPTGPGKRQREAELQAMMDQEDEEMEDAGTPVPDEPEEEVEPPIDDTVIAKQEEEEPKESVTVENGRRRGRRRVMKKKTVKDEEGYLVTKEEAAWESFSEDEPPPKKAKLPSTAPASIGSKAPAGTAKKGAKPKGNIMSFFGKK